MGVRLQGAFVLVLAGVVVYGCVRTAGDSRSVPALTWHYNGPANRVDLAKQVIDVLVDACPRIGVYNEYFTKPDVAWRGLPGSQAAIAFTAVFKDQPISPEPVMPLFSPDRKLTSDDRVDIVLLGPPATAIAIRGSGGFFLCEIDKPPVGRAPAIKHEPRLSGLVP